MTNVAISIPDIVTRVEQALNTVRPYLATDGGDIRVVELTDDMVLRLEWLGNCSSCAMSPLTLKTGIEDAVLNSVSEIKSIEVINELS
jgi:Fe-S cluster biogenesis protein NfuA